MQSSFFKERKLNNINHRIAYYVITILLFSFSIVLTCSTFVISATISGQVIQQETGNPVEHENLLSISVYDVTNNSWFSSNSISVGLDGSYEILNLPVGTYKVAVKSSWYTDPYWAPGTYFGYTNCWWNSGMTIVDSFYLGEEIQINTANQSLSNINFSIKQASYIGGSLYESDGITPHDLNYEVIIWNAKVINGDPCNAGENTGTMPSFHYSISTPPGSYILLAKKHPSGKLITYYTGDNSVSTDCNDAHIITVTDYGQTHGEKDLAFDLTNTVTPLSFDFQGTGSGKVILSSSGNEYSTDFTEDIPTGENITLKVIADEGSFFNGWSGQKCSGMSTQCLFNSNDPSTIIANFRSVDAKIKNVANTTHYADHVEVWADLSINDQLSESMCDEFTFNIVEKDDSGEYVPVAHGDSSSCKYLPDQSLWNSRRYKLVFSLAHRSNIDSTYYTKAPKAKFFEDGRLSISPKTAPTNWGIIPRNRLDNFSVVGNSFDYAKDTFNFKNRSWGKVATTDYSNGAEKNDFALYGDVIAKYLHDSRRSDFWDSVGWGNTFGWFWSSEKSKGLCYGMSLIAASHFNQPESEDSWGVGYKDYAKRQEEWDNSIKSRWNKTTGLASPPYKPLTGKKTLFEYKDTSEVLRKIMYYFVGQWAFLGSTKLAEEHFKKDLITRNSGENWRGIDSLFSATDKQYWTWNLSNKVDSEDFLNAVMKYGKVAEITIKGTGLNHSILAVQYLSWNGHDKWLFYDNEMPLSEARSKDYAYYKEWYIDDNTDYDLSSTTNSSNKLINFVAKQSGNSIENDYSIVFIRAMTFSPHGSVLPSNYSTYSAIDPQNIYGFRSSQQPIPPQNLMHNDTFPVLKSPQPRTNSDLPTSLDDSSKIKILLIGTSTIDIFDSSNGDTITPIPYGSNDDEAATIYKEGSFTTVYLDAIDTYSILAKKDSSFPFMKVYVTVPYTDGRIENLNYEAIQNEPNDSTEIQFIVGRGIIEKSMSRSLNGRRLPDYSADYDHTYTRSVNSPSSFNGEMNNTSSITLNWNNPSHQGFDSAILVRKVGAPILSVTDGAIIYDGTAENYTDNNIPTGILYYSLYSKDTGSNISSSPVTLVIDTSKFQIHGSIISDGTTVENAEIIVRDETGRIIDKAVTTASGQYFLYNYSPGIYTLIASHPAFTIENDTREITVLNSSIEENFSAIAIPFLQLLWSDREAPAGSTIELSWLYRNITDDSLVTIEANDGTGFTEISQVRADRGWINWQVFTKEATNAQLRVSLTTDPSTNSTTSFEVVSNPNYTNTKSILYLALPGILNAQKSNASISGDDL